MIFKLLAVGDVVGESGVAMLRERLPRLRKAHGVGFVVVNGENADGVGIHPRQADAIFEAGADVITLGNHTWNRLQIAKYLDSHDAILRPANFTSRVPGRGFGVFAGPQGIRVGVLNLIGRTGMDPNVDNPFPIAQRLLRDGDCDVAVVDLHAEATSEKGAMAWYLDGKAAALWGTHTHVPTADLQILPGGLGFVTDLGMTGPSQSVLGIRPESALNRFLGGLPTRYEPAEGPCKLESVLFTLDAGSGKCLGLERLDVFE